MRIKINAVTDSPTFPEQVDVVVIGGGIIGTSVAYELAKQGVTVALFEKGAIGCEQSGRAFAGSARYRRRHAKAGRLCSSALRGARSGY